MSWMTRARYSLARWLLKAGALPIVPGWLTESFITPSFASLTKEGYQRNAAFLSCVEALAMAYPEPLLRAYDGDGEDAQPLDGHPLRLLLTRPNPRMGEGQLKLITMAYMAIGGNAYWHKVRDGGGRVRELWPYHAGQIRVVPGGGAWVKEYVFEDPAANLTRIPVEDIVHFQWPTPDPEQPWQAMPPLRAAAREVDTDNEATRYLHALLRNDAVPRTVITFPKDAVVDDAQQKRMRQQWGERYGGDNRGSPAFLEEGASVQRLSLNLEELAFEALHKIPEARIAAVLRVPPIIAGLNVGLDRSTFANYGEARRAFTETTLVPLWELTASTITAQLLLPDLGGAAAARYDTSRVKSLQEDTTARWDRAGKAYDKGIVTKNEARRYMGFADAADGDTYKAPAPASAVTASRAAGETRMLPAPATAKALPAGVQRIRRAAAAAVADYLASQYQRAADAIRDAAKRETLDPAIVEQLGLDLGPELQTILRRYHGRAVERAFANAASDLEIDLTFALDNPKVQDVLDELAGEVAGITETTRSAIRALIGRQAAEGWSVPELARAIEAAGLETRARAEVIARTESAAAYSKGSLLAWAESGVVRASEWLTSDPCPVCAGLAGQVAALGERFPGGLSHPPAHPGCECALLPVLIEE